MSTEPNEFDDICLITHPLSDAGENATRSLLDILTALTTVSVVTIDLPEDSTIRSSHPVTELSSTGTTGTIVLDALRFAVNQLRMCVAIARRNESVLWFFGSTSYLLPILFGRLLGRTVVVQPRGDVPLSLKLQWADRMPNMLAAGLAGTVGLIERLGFRLATHIVTYTPSMAVELGLDRYDGKLHTDGARYVDTEVFYPKIPFEERELVVGYLGRLDEEKGIRNLADAVKQLPDNVTFVFIGDGDLRDWLESELAAEIQSERVEITGWVNHDAVPEQLSRCRLLVFLSTPTEGLPTSILEAFACATPVAATPVAGVPDVVEDGETGVILESSEPKEVARSLETTLDDSRLHEWSSNARTLVESQYSLEAATDRYRTILDNIAA